ncbi:MAG TPA: TIM barrel protein [Planctomycetota bacterium]|nr:TIM barrel protein [Planctomycetota bacterium]
MTQPGIPNEYSLSTSCYGSRLRTIEDQAFAAVAMGFRRLELGLSESPVPLNGFEETRRETGISVASMVCGCLNPRSEHMSGTRLGSLKEDLRERALISVRRHVSVAQQYGCPVVILRGCAVENADLEREAGVLDGRLAEEGTTDEVAGDIRDFVGRVEKKGQRQVEHLCRSLHGLHQSFPEVQFALEPGVGFNDILNFEAMGWVLTDLARQGVGYWHDTGTIHLREQAGLPGQGDWLEAYGDRLQGVHLQDAAGEEAAMPPGLGEIDFRRVAEYIPESVEKVVEIDPRHGRAEILGAVQFLVDLSI